MQVSECDEEFDVNSGSYPFFYPATLSNCRLFQFKLLILNIL